MEAKFDDPVLDDFRNFLYLVWKFLGLPDPTPVQYDIAYYLQHGPTRSVIQAFRGAGKSWITSAFVCWCLLRDPENKILVVSANSDRSGDFANFVSRLIMNMPELAHLKPRKGQRFSANAMDVGPATPAHMPSIKSIGITGQLEGSRANIIIPDDVEVEKNSLTQVQRDRLKAKTREFSAILIPEGDQKICYLGTPQTEMSLYNDLPERGFHVRVWPARYPTQKQLEMYGEKLAPWIRENRRKYPEYEWQPVDPQRFNEHDLQEREADWGRSGFALQFMLDTNLSDAEKFPLKLSDLIVMDLSPEIAPRRIVYASGPQQEDEELPNVGLSGDRFYRPMWVDDNWEPYEVIAMAIDPSGRGGDETGYAVVGLLHGTLYCLECSGFIGGYDERTLEGLAKIAKRYKPNDVLIEDNFGDGMFTQLIQPYLRRHHNVMVEEVKNSAQKERRIISDLEPLMNQHRLVMNTAVIRDDYEKTEDKHYQLLHQMTRLTHEKDALAHDDRLEALQIACYRHLRAMSLDEEQEANESYEQELDEMLEHFEAACLDEPPTEDRRWAPV